jgi:hypothetical protein
VLAEALALLLEVVELEVPVPPLPSVTAVEHADDATRSEKDSADETSKNVEARMSRHRSTRRPRARAPLEIVRGTSRSSSTPILPFRYLSAGRPAREAVVGEGGLDAECA